MRKLTKEETWKNLSEKRRRAVGWAKKIGFYFGGKAGGEGATRTFYICNVIFVT